MQLGYTALAFTATFSIFQFLTVAPLRADEKAPSSIEKQVKDPGRDQTKEAHDGQILQPQESEEQPAVTPAVDGNKVVPQTSAVEPSEDGSEKVITIHHERRTNSKVQNKAIKPVPTAKEQEGDDELAKRLADRRSMLVRAGLSFRGTPYLWGGDSPRAFDCSGFTQYLYRRMGIKLPHKAALQFKMGKPVSKGALKQGDLVFFNTNGPLSHVGMYIGDGKFVHAANPRRGVTTDNLSSGYYAKCYAGARRYR